jgi:hypothetical protein
MLANGDGEEEDECRAASGAMTRAGQRDGVATAARAAGAARREELAMARLHGASANMTGNVYV